MKRNSKKKLLSLIVATIMMVALMGATVSATETTYTPITLTNTSFPSISKVLDMPEDASVPACGFSFAIESGEAISATTTHQAVLAGPKATYNNKTYPLIENITFSANESKDTTPATGISKGTSKTKTTIIDFSHVEFKEPGVYRYVITEATAENYLNIGVGHDEYNQRVLDIYIVDNNGALEFSNYIITKKKASEDFEAPSITETTFGEKSSAFINEYPTNTLKISKKVAGNQGSKDEYFKFTLTLEATSTVPIEDTLVFGITGQTLEPTQTGATSYTADEMKLQNNITTLTGAQLKAGYVIYLQHDDEVIISGLVKNCKFNITEDNKNYTVTTVLKKTGKSDVTGDNHTVTGVLDENTSVEFTNTKTGVIPTGVILSATGLIIAALIAVVGVVFFGMRSRRRFEEE